MTLEEEKDLADIKRLADLLFDKEEGDFKAIRNRQLALEEQKQAIEDQARAARASASQSIADMPQLFAYLEVLATRLRELIAQGEKLQEEEEAQKAKLKTALGRQIQVDGLVEQKRDEQP